MMMSRCLSDHFGPVGIANLAVQHQRPKLGNLASDRRWRVLLPIEYCMVARRNSKLEDLGLEHRLPVDSNLEGANWGKLIHVR